MSPDQKTLYVVSHDTRILGFDRVLPPGELPGKGRPAARKGTMQLDTCKRMPANQSRRVNSHPDR